MRSRLQTLLTGEHEGDADLRSVSTQPPRWDRWGWLLVSSTLSRGCCSALVGTRAKVHVLSGWTRRFCAPGFEARRTSQCG
eukprot:7552330-Pyramimonas_sp.AAC.1